MTDNKTLRGDMSMSRVVVDDAYRQAEKEFSILRETQNIVPTKEQIAERAIEIRLEKFNRIGGDDR